MYGPSTLCENSLSYGLPSSFNRLIPLKLLSLCAVVQYTHHVYKCCLHIKTFIKQSRWPFLPFNIFSRLLEIDPTVGPGTKYSILFTHALSCGDRSNRGTGSRYSILFTHALSYGDRSNRGTGTRYLILFTHAWSCGDRIHHYGSTNIRDTWGSALIWYMYSIRYTSYVCHALAHPSLWIRSP